MGSWVELTIHDLAIDVGKNRAYRDHGCLFDRSDLHSALVEYVDQDGDRVTYTRESVRRSLSSIVDRLDLLGYTVSAAERMVAAVDICIEDSLLIPCPEIADALQRVDLSAAVADDDTTTTALHGRLARLLYDHLAPSLPSVDAASARWHISDVLEQLDPYVILSLLARSPDNQDSEVVWDYADIVEGGWVDREIIVDSLGPSPRFLIVTEGSSDAQVIRRALRWLRPNVADFFSFVDMREGYPFTGTSNLHRFCQGLTKLGIENQIIFVYDNDTAGVSQYNKTRGLSLPSNFGVMRLPDIPSLEAFDTLGPNGDAEANINGRAASIECYLDLRWKQAGQPVVRWVSYDKTARSYQGELVNKKQYTKAFLKIRNRPKDYDTSGLESVVERLISVAISIAELNPNPTETV